MKKFAVPLQAFAALILCSGMAWMVFVLGSLNPTPPTVNDLKARNTQDLSFANMNSTAVALAKDMLADMVPSPSSSFFLPVTGRETATPSAEVAVTLKPVYTNAATLTPSPNYPSPTATRKRKDKDNPVMVATVAPSNTSRPHTAVIPTIQIPTEPTQVPTKISTPTTPSAYP